MNKYRIVCIIASCILLIAPALAAEDSVFAEKLSRLAMDRFVHLSIT